MRRLSRICLVILVADFCIQSGEPRAQDATWLANPSSGSYNSAANWSTNAVPTGTAFFGFSNTTSLSILGATIGGWTFNAGGSSYGLTNFAGPLAFTGAGIVVNGGSATLNLRGFNAVNGRLSFQNSSSAGSATITNAALGSAASSFVFFNDNSSAGNAVINNTNTVATHTGATVVAFKNNSTAANAVINNNLGAGTVFGDNSTAASATITVNANGSVNNLNSSVTFLNNSSGGGARFILYPGGIFDMSGLATAGMTAGSIEGAGSYILGSKALIVGGNNLSSEVSGVISGVGGSLTKSGTGTLILSGNNSYTGPTTVNAGTLVVNGSIASSNSLTVNAGGTVGGTGTLTTTTISGGTLAPGNSIGTISINGSLTFVGAGNYVVELSPGGADRTNVSGTPGTASLGGTLQAIATAGTYTLGSRYVVLSAIGGVSGTFSNLAISGSFGDVRPHIEYDANDVYLVFGPNALSLAGLRPNESAVASAINTAVLAGNQSAPLVALFDLSAAQLSGALDQLSGEVHATTLSVLADESLYARAAILGRLRQASRDGDMGSMAALRMGGPQAFAGADEIGSVLAYAKSPIVTKAPMLAPQAASENVFWAQGFGAWGKFNSDGNAAAGSRNLAGFISGVDTRVGGYGRVGLAAGYAGSQNNTDGRGSANIDTGHVAAYGGWSLGALSLRGGADLAFHTIATDRTIAFPGFSDRAFSNYSGSTGQIFAEAGYDFALANIAIEPFAGAAWVRVHTDSASERALAAGLNFASANFVVGYSMLGVRAASLVPLANRMILIPRASVAWQHAFGNVAANDVLAFQAAPATPFTTSGVPIARDAALIEAGLDLALNAHAMIGISYSGQLASNVTDHAAKGKFSWKF